MDLQRCGLSVHHGTTCSESPGFAAGKSCCGEVKCKSCLTPSKCKCKQGIKELWGSRNLNDLTRKYVEILAFTRQLPHLLCGSPWPCLDDRISLASPVAPVQLQVVQVEGVLQIPLAVTSPMQQEPWRELGVTSSWFTVTSCGSCSVPCSFQLVMDSFLWQGWPHILHITHGWISLKKPAGSRQSGGQESGLLAVGRPKEYPRVS